MPTSVVSRSLESMQIHLKQIFLFRVDKCERPLLVMQR